ncbi:MAG: proline racemase family protein [Acidobacteriota bacterium]|nr:proline racemase family protein [Acidobacteriota bacterium]
MHVIDSHTGGEPTRVVIEGGPELGGGPLAERARIFRETFDHIRSAIVNEPRGNDAIVGALLCPPHDPACSAGVIFFNNVGLLNMCGHGTIGLAVTLSYLGRIGPGLHRIETPVGIVEAILHDANHVTVNNVPSYRHAANVEVEVEGCGTVHGDIAWGGNWFFLTKDCPYLVDLANLEALTNYSWAIRQALERNGITGANHGHIDHIEICGPSGIADSRNFVLCPGKAYDRSPCGTGTSAKLACLYADGDLKEGEIWRQESVIGSIFEGSITIEGAAVLPHIKGSAWIDADAVLLLDPADPFVHGIGAS